MAMVRKSFKLDGTTDGGDEFKFRRRTRDGNMLPATLIDGDGVFSIDSEKRRVARALQTEK